MKIAVLGHSMIHVRQQKYFQQLAGLGHHVLLVSPGQWGEQRTRPVQPTRVGRGVYELATLQHSGGDDQYGFRLIGLCEALDAFNPDWVYIQQEPESQLAQQAILHEVPEGAKRRYALFTWENMPKRATVQDPSRMTSDLVRRCSLVVCGNGEAEAIMRPYAKRAVVTLQVGVDTDHFQARPGVARDIQVGYVGRIAPEKGVGELATAWPKTAWLEWKPWEQLPWWYSRIRIVVTFSQDTPFWREQAPNYVTCEAMCCGAAVVTSDGGSIPFWLQRGAAECPGAIVVPQQNTIMLARVLDALVRDPERTAKMALEGRAWVEEHLSTRVLARKLAEELESAG